MQYSILTMYFLHIHLTLKSILCQMKKNYKLISFIVFCSIYFQLNAQNNLEKITKSNSVFFKPLAVLEPNIKLCGGLNINLTKVLILKNSIGVLGLIDRSQYGPVSGFELKSEVKKLFLVNVLENKSSETYFSYEVGFKNQEYKSKSRSIFLDDWGYNYSEQYVAISNLKLGKQIRHKNKFLIDYYVGLGLRYKHIKSSGENICLPNISLGLDLGNIIL